MDERVSQLLESWAHQDPSARERLMPLVLVGLDRMQWRDRAHFMAMAATLMRPSLVDYARARRSEKRGGDISITSIEDHDAAGPEYQLDLIALDEALARLASFDRQQTRIVEMRFFGGLTVEETADALSISPTTVKREWAAS